MKLTFENLLYDHSLKPLFQMDTGDSDRNFYPGFEQILSALREEGRKVEIGRGARNTFILDGNHQFSIRYRAKRQNAFSKVDGGTIIAIMYTGDGCFQMASGTMDELGASDTGPWSVQNQESWQTYSSKEDLTAAICTLVRGGVVNE